MSSFLRVLASGSAAPVRGALCGGVVLALLSVPPAGATAVPAGTGAEYLDLVRRYRDEPGLEATLSELLSWDPGTVRRVVREVGLGTTRQDHRAATLLHGEAAFLAYRRGEDALGEFHIKQGLELLEGTAGDVASESWTGRWLLAVGLFHASGGYPRDAIPFLEDAIKIAPDHPQLLLVLGQVEENLATRRIRGWAPRKVQDSRRDVRYEMRRDSADGSLLRDAEAHLRRALALDPGLHEARLHLGRTLQARGSLSEARECLQAVAAAQPGEYMAYVASLLLGGLAESAGDLVTAADHYREAVETDPRGQVAAIALAHVTHRQGSRGQSSRVVEDLLSRKARLVFQPDGWWRFRMGPLGDGPRLESLMAELRAEVAQ